jgi:LPS sulfotransferase NodH
VLHIERDDVLGQAISYCIADDTKRWSSLHREPPASEPTYDAERIRRVMREIAMAGLRVRLTCEVLGLRRIPVSYEELTADSHATLRRISAELDVDLDLHALKPPALRKQADATNARFRARFLRDLYGTPDGVQEP